MKKLSKDQIAQLDLIHQTALAEQAAFDEAREAYQKAKLMVVSILTAAADTIRDFESEAQQFFEEKSERWQEGDKGQAYAAWIEALGDRAQTLEVDDETLDDDEIDTIIAAINTEDFPCEPEG